MESSDQQRASQLRALVELLHRYYSHGLTKVDPASWKELAVYNDPENRRCSPEVHEAIGRIAEAPLDDAQEFEFEYNRLFVGPEQLPAPPYETIYVSTDPTLMRQVTMSVRQAYLDHGIAISSKNVEPDDHLAFEFLFASKLIEDGSLDELSGFLDDHMNKWIEGHATAIRDNSANQVILGFADLAQSVISELNELVCSSATDR